VARGCIFCGAKPLTREHLFPLWLSEIVRDGADFFSHADGKGRNWSHPKLDIKVKCVCGPCNWGWMHELEDEAAPTLTPLIRGEARTLTANDQRLIGRWVAKTATVVTSVERRAAQVPADLRRLVRDQTEPPRNVHIDLYAYGPGLRAVWYRADVLQMESVKLYRPPNVGHLHSVALSVGHFVALAGIFPVANMTVMPPPGDATFRVNIWPGGPDVDWPPQGILDEDGLDRLPAQYLSKPENYERFRREIEDASD
jgi:hypothetical protein